MRHSVTSFRPRRLLGGGHRQTIWAALQKPPPVTWQTKTVRLTLRDGDHAVLHDDQPPDWQPGSPSLLLLHGLCGSHASSYMVRLALQFYRHGVRTFRMDMRGCGAAASLSESVTHAGRGEDALDALHWIAQQTERGPLIAIGVSLGGNQLLRAVGTLSSEDAIGDIVRSRMQRVVTIAPPIDLLRCSQHMLRPGLRPYHWYFVSQLLRRVPPKVRQSPAFAQLDLRRRPRTIFELDDRITAPLAGFQDAVDYYQQCSSTDLLRCVEVPTLVLASEDDPLIPVAIFQDAMPSSQVDIQISRKGGHAGYLCNHGNRWLDGLLIRWLLA